MCKFNVASCCARVQMAQPWVTLTATSNRLDQAICLPNTAHVNVYDRYPTLSNVFPNAMMVQMSTQLLVQLFLKLWTLHICFAFFLSGSL